VGLKSDGTVVAVGYNNYGQCDAGGWIDILLQTTNLEVEYSTSFPQNYHT